MHTEDAARAVWASAAWIIKHGRAECDRLAGETLKHFPLDLDGDGYTEETVKKLLDPSVTPTVVAPLFNLVCGAGLIQRSGSFLLPLANHYGPPHLGG